MNEAEHRKLAQSITHSLELKGYRRDVPNNIFIKKCSDEYFDYNEIRFVKDTVLITNLHYRLIHSFNINDLIAKKGSKMALTVNVCAESD